MKIIDINFNEQLRGKVISVGDKDDYMMEEAAIEFTGRTWLRSSAAKTPYR